MLSINAKNSEMIGFESKDLEPVVVVEKDSVKEINLSNICLVNKESLNGIGKFLIGIVRKIGTIK